MTFKILDIHHDSFIVKDLQRALGFYCAVLQLEIDHTRPTMSVDGAWLKVGENRQIHLLEIDYPISDHPQIPKHGGRDRHSAFLINNIAELKQLLDQHHIDYNVSKSGRAALFTRDPDSNALEFVQK